MKITTNNLSHYGDILAIPFFALLAFYFYNKEQKTTMEYILFVFSLLGFVLDIFYTMLFLGVFTPTKGL